MGTGSAVYETVSGGAHHHLVCSQCGQVITIDHQTVDLFFANIEKDFRFQVITNHLILFGVCKTCREKGQ
jgi:Fur family ferric uptake transcriptional regulator